MNLKWFRVEFFLVLSLFSSLEGGLEANITLPK
jgi:hypothetical protein